MSRLAIRRFAAAVAASLVACGGSGKTTAPDGRAGPAVPQGVTATALHGGIQVSWNAAPGATGYVVAWSTDATFDPGVATSVDVAGTTWSRPYFVGGQTVSAAVQAVVGGVGGPWSTTVTAVILPRISSLTFDPPALVLQPGQDATIGLVATFEDATTEDVSMAAAWTIDGTASVTVGTPTRVATQVGDFGGTVVAAEWEGYRATLRVGVRRGVDLVAFTTSRFGSSNLGTWADAAGATGLAAADAVCAAHAERAGLPGTYRAWLSTPTDDAWCRVAGFSGKKSASCGQGALPDAGPWVRTDGFPLAEPLSSSAVAPGRLLVAPGLDEWGAELHASTENLNSSLPDGTYATSTDCAGFGAAPGQSFGGTDAWDVHLTGASRGGCGSHGGLHLLCMGTGTGPALPPYAADGKRIFVSRATGLGDLSAWTGADGATGAAAGDALCRTWAAAAGLSSAASFRALLSSTASPASARISSDGPWVRGDGVLVARNRADLLARRVLTAVSLDEYGVPVALTRKAFTALALDEDCADWTDAVSGNADAWYAYDGAQTRGYSWLCGSESSLICAED